MYGGVVRNSLVRTTCVALALLFLAAACASGPDATGSDATGSDATGSDATGSDASGPDATGSTDDDRTSGASSSDANSSTGSSTDSATDSATGSPSSGRHLGVPASLLDSLDSCGQANLCGTVLADDGYSVRYRVVPATGSKPIAGVLVMHFGGPGTDAREIVPRLAPADPEQSVLGQFDIVGVEQRGTDANDGVDCGNDAIYHQLQAGTVAPADQPRLAQQWISGCPAGSLGSATAASDIAAVLKHLNPGRAVFVGYSYGGVIGVLLGANHADVIDALVLDSPAVGWLDPKAGLYQVREFSQALDWNLDQCDQTLACEFAPNGNAEARFRLLANSYEVPGDLMYATAQLLYNEQDFPILDAMVTAALAGDDSLITRVADAYHQRVGQTYPPSSEVFTLVACSDKVEEFTDDFSTAQAELRSYGVFGELVAKGQYDPIGICDYWAGEQKAFELDLSHSEVPILLVASTNDPAVPWETVQPFIASSLPPSAGVAVVHDFTHALWRQGFACIDEAVDAFIIDNTLPTGTGPASDGAILDCDPVPSDTP